MSFSTLLKKTRTKDEIVDYVESTVKKEHPDNCFFYCHPCQYLCLSKEAWTTHITVEVAHKKCVVRWRLCQDLQNERLQEGAAFQKYFFTKNKPGCVVIGLFNLVEISNANGPHHFVCILCNEYEDTIEKALAHVSSFDHVDRMMGRIDASLYFPPSRQMRDTLTNRTKITNELKSAVFQQALKHVSKHGSGTMKKYTDAWLQNAWVESEEREKEEESLLLEGTKEIFDDPSNFELKCLIIPRGKCVATTEYKTCMESSKLDVMGIQYIVELWMPSRRVIPAYYCSLCDVLTIDWEEHTKSLGHSISYLEKHYNGLYETIISKFTSGDSLIQNVQRTKTLIFKIEGDYSQYMHILQLKIETYDCFMPLDATIVRNLVKNLQVAKKLIIHVPPLAAETSTALKLEYNKFLDLLSKMSEETSENQKVESVSSLMRKNVSNKVEVKPDSNAKIEAASKNKSVVPLATSKNGINEKKEESSRSAKTVKKVEPTKSSKQVSSSVKQDNKNENPASVKQDNKNEKPSSVKQDNKNEKPKITTEQIMKRSGYTPNSKSSGSMQQAAKPVTKHDNSGFFKTQPSSRRSPKESITKYTGGKFSAPNVSKKSQVLPADRDRPFPVKRYSETNRPSRKFSPDRFDSKRRKFDDDRYSKKSPVRSTETSFFRSVRNSPPRPVPRGFQPGMKFTEFQLEKLTSMFRSVDVDLGRRLTEKDIEVIRQNVGADICDRLLENCLSNSEFAEQVPNQPRAVYKKGSADDYGGRAKVDSFSMRPEGGIAPAFSRDFSADRWNPTVVQRQQRFGASSPPRPTNIQPSGPDVFFREPAERSVEKFPPTLPYGRQPAFSAFPEREANVFNSAANNSVRFLPQVGPVNAPNRDIFVPRQQPNSFQQQQPNVFSQQPGGFRHQQPNVFPEQNFNRSTAAVPYGAGNTFFRTDNGQILMFKPNIAQTPSLGSNFFAPAGRR